MVLHELANIVEWWTGEGAMFVQVSEAGACQAVCLQLGASSVQVHATTSYKQFQNSLVCKQKNK